MPIAYFSFEAMNPNFSILVQIRADPGRAIGAMQ